MGIKLIMKSHGEYKKHFLIMFLHKKWIKFWILIWSVVILSVVALLEWERKRVPLQHRWNTRWDGEPHYATGEMVLSTSRYWSAPN